MKRQLSGVMTLALVLVVFSIVQARDAKATVIGQYVANSDPTTQGFVAGACCGSSTAGPLTNDQGLPAWQITGQSQSSQYSYSSPAFTSAQLADIAANGFTLTLTGRALQNMAPAASPGSEVSMAGATVAYDNLQWIIDLGIDASGNTIVVLPNTYNNNTQGGYILDNGPSVTTPGSGYNTYQLVYDPTTASASLFINGLQAISGYAGDTSYSSGRSGFGFEADSGAQGNFNFVGLSSGMLSSQPSAPEPGALALMGIGLCALVLVRAKGRRTA